MQLIHIEPDELRAQSHLMDEHIRLMLDVEYRLKQYASQLDMAWQGGDSSEFLNELETLRRLLHQKINEYFFLSSRLIREADRWEESDQTWVAEFRKLLG